MFQRNSALDISCNKVCITQILHTLSEKSFQSIQANPICIGKNTSNNNSSPILIRSKVILHKEFHLSKGFIKGKKGLKLKSIK